MILRIAVFAMMALFLGGLGTVAWLTLQAAPPPEPVAVAADAPAPPPVRHMVLAASGALRAGTLLKPEDVQPVDLAEPPAGAQDDTVDVRASLVGAMLRRSLSPRDPVLAADVLRPGDHGFLAAVLAPGYRAASVGVDAISGSAGLIWPGDHVDVILTLSLEDPALPAGHRVAAETVLSDVRVIAIDQLLAHGVAPSADQSGAGRTVTLEVKPGDAERVAVATKLGRLSLAVRSAEPGADAPPSSVAPGGILALATSPVSGGKPVAAHDNPTTWGGDVSPALGGAAGPAKASPMMRVYTGNADGKEFRFQ